MPTIRTTTERARDSRLRSQIARAAKRSKFYPWLRPASCGSPHTPRSSSSRHKALQYLRSLFTHGATMPDVGSEWPAVERLYRDLFLTGNWIPDAWIAAVVTTNGYHLVTFDKDFRKLLRRSEFTLLLP